MRILIVGSGGREHALAWKVAQSPLAKKVFVAPGNAGTALENKVQNIAVQADDIPALVRAAKRYQIDLTIVGPEQPLVAGIVDIFSRHGLTCFGPSQEAAQLEASKTFTKDFLARQRIPTAAYRSFSQLESALAYINAKQVPMVIKADGLAAGKGVVVAQDLATAQQAARSMLAEHAFGKAGQRIVVEDFLRGEEASFMVVVAGEQVLAMASSQDHKARDDADRGPNTGGMGAYSPAPVLTDAVTNKVMAQIIMPTVRGLAAEGISYTGFLYAGLMVDHKGDPKLLEYNCRLGDPETQPIVLRMQSDLLELCLAAQQRRLNQYTLQWDARAALGVVMASSGYPSAYRKGDIITGLPESAQNLKVFHAGTRAENGQILTDGGRVLCVTALGETVLQAQLNAYEISRNIHWPGAISRTDIGFRAVARETAAIT